MTSTLPELGAHVGEGGKYRIVRKLGEGGMGAVYEAEQALTGKRVALKWMQPGSGAGAELAARFLQEAQAAARVRHPNVVDVYDIGREGEAAYLVMEYLEGETLGAALARGALSPGQVITLLLPVLRATASAHKQGVVHRDIKPDNIFLAQHEGGIEPKLLDFGISKLAPRDGSQSSLTRTGTTMGTPRYMSFEQLAGEKDIDGRTDVYAFGVILYEVLTGRPPFEAETFSALVVKMATSTPPSVASLRHGVPAALAEAVRWAMERERDPRCPSIDALIAALEPFAEAAAGASTAQGSVRAAGGTLHGVGPRTDARAAGPARGVRWAVAALLLVGLVGALWLLRRGPGDGAQAGTPPATVSPVVPPGPEPVAPSESVGALPAEARPAPHRPAQPPAATPRAELPSGLQRPHAQPRRGPPGPDPSGAPPAAAEAAPAAAGGHPGTGSPAGAEDPSYYVTPDGRRIVRAPTPSAGPAGAATPLGGAAGRSGFPLR